MCNTVEYNIIQYSDICYYTGIIILYNVVEYNIIQYSDICYYTGIIILYNVVVVSKILGNKIININDLEVQHECHFKDVTFCFEMLVPHTTQYVLRERIRVASPSRQAE